MFYQIKRYLLTKFGDIKIFKWPMYVLYHPTSFRIKGLHTREILNIVQPGDLVMRSYINYLDGYFIPKGDSDCSHGGLYVGDGKIVHAIAEGTLMDDIIDFCRCDRILILRPCYGQQWAVEHARKCADQNIEYDFDFEPGNGKYYCHELMASCFPYLDIRPLSRPVPVFQCIGLNIPSPVAFLSDSFYVNRHFTSVYESNGGALR